MSEAIPAVVRMSACANANVMCLFSRYSLAGAGLVWPGYMYVLLSDLPCPRSYSINSESMSGDRERLSETMEVCFA